MSKKKRDYKAVRVHEVDIDKTNSPWGYVVLNLHGESKDRWKHFFKSPYEWDQFYALWSKLPHPFVLELDDSTNPMKNYWRAHNG